MHLETTTPSVDTATRPLQRTFVITQHQAAAWLEFLREFKCSTPSATGLANFRDALADACWLARWSRSYVTLDVPVCELPAIIADLVDHAESSRDQAQAAVGDEILRSLSAS